MTVSYGIQQSPRRKRCVRCKMLTYNWEHYFKTWGKCYDGCHSTTGIDCRTYDAMPAWLPYKGKPAWDPSRMIK